MIDITESAATQIRTQIDKRGHGLGLRVGVRKTGCSGYAYQLDYVDELKNGDEIFEKNQIKIIINAHDMPLLNGITVDYQREGLNRAFKFINPNAKGECGCGESFNV